MKKNTHRVLSTMCSVAFLFATLSMNSEGAANKKKSEPKSQQLVPTERTNPERRNPPSGQNVAVPARPAARPTANLAAGPVARPTSRPTANLAAGPVARPTLRPATRPTTKPASKPSTGSEEEIVRKKLAKLGSKVAAIAAKRLSTESATRPEANLAAEPAARPTTNLAAEPAARPAAKPNEKHLEELGSEVAAIAAKRAPINPEELEASQRREYLKNSLSNIMAECSVGASYADIKDSSGNIVIEKFVALYVNKLNIAYRNHVGRNLFQDFSISKAVEHMSEKNKMNNERCRFLEFIANYLDTKLSETTHVEEISSLALATHCIAQILDAPILSNEDADFICTFVMNMNPEIASPISKQDLHIFKIIMYNLKR